MVQLQQVKDLCDIYLTQESIVNNFWKVFGYRNETLAIRFYSFLADGYQGVHIYLPVFYAKLHGLIEGHTMQLNLFGFSLLDSERKGVIFSTDIADMIQNALA